MILSHCPRKLWEWASGWQKFPCLGGLGAIAGCVKAEIGLGRPFGSFVKEEEGYHPFVANLVLVVSQTS